MFLVGHAAVAAALTASITNPAAAFGIGWLSHYLADFFPHGDEELGAWTKRGNEVKRLLLAVGIDAAILAVVLAAFIRVNGFSIPMFAAVVGSAVPDVMWGLEKLFKRRLFGFHEKFHGKNHNFFHVRLPLWAGFVGQAAVLVPLWLMVSLRGA